MKKLILAAIVVLLTGCMLHTYTNPPDPPDPKAPAPSPAPAATPEAK